MTLLLQHSPEASSSERREEILSLASSREGFDLVLFMGGFCHLRYPMLALDIVARLVRRVMVFQTVASPGEGVCEGELNQHDVEERNAFSRARWGSGEGAAEFRAATGQERSDSR